MYLAIALKARPFYTCKEGEKKKKKTTGAFVKVHIPGILFRFPKLELFSRVQEGAF